jgi:hypothetical protein
MSALGQKQPLGHLQPMSALPPKADIAERRRLVRFESKADIAVHSCDVRFTPKSGHQQNASGCLLSATSRQGWLRYPNRCVALTLNLSSDSKRLED